MEHLPHRAYRVAETLFAGPYPRSPGALVRAGVGEFVDLTGHEPGYERLLPAHAHRTPFPIVDFGVPSVGLMTAILDHIDARLPAGVYVHCARGIGRTGTVVGCWLLRHGHTNTADWEEALASLRPPDAPPSPETMAQRAFVSGWRRGQ